MFFQISSWKILVVAMAMTVAFASISEKIYFVLPCTNFVRRALEAKEELTPAKLKLKSLIQ